MRLLAPTSYRYDIQGLRGLAVVLVLLFHYDNNRFHIGHVGVDIFFVISGYVISKVLSEKYLCKNDARILSFYKKRFWRIFPALAVCVIISTCFYFLFGQLRTLTTVNLTAATSLLFISNIFLQIAKADYFAVESANIFEHTWSLGIEFQYYLIYPIFLLILLKKISNKRVGITLFILAAILFIGQISQTYDDQKYFSIPFRFGEILLGCATYYITATPNNSKFYVMVSSFFALGILLIIIYIHPIFHRVYAESLFASILTVIFIAQPSNRIKEFFGSSILMFLGKISYSIYLYHLPVIFLLSAYPLEYRFFITSMIILALSYLSYTFIENPINKGYLHIQLNSLRIVGRLTGVFIIVVGVFIVLFFVRRDVDFPMSSLTKRVFQKSDLISQSNGLRESIEEAAKDMSHFIYDVNFIESAISEYRIKERTTRHWYVKDKLSSRKYCQPSSDSFTLNKYNLRDECSSKNYSEGDDFFLLVGNSHAEHYIPMFNNSRLINSYYMLAVGGCLDKSNLSECSKTISLQVENLSRLMQLSRRTFIVLPFYDIKTFKYVVDWLSNLLRLNNVSIILFSPTPNVPDFESVYKIASYPCFAYGKNCTFSKNSVEHNRITEYQFSHLVNPILNKFNIKTYTFRPDQIICRNEICSLFDKKNDILFYFDGHHLSNEGSIFLSSFFDDFLKSILSGNRT